GVVAVLPGAGPCPTQLTETRRGIAAGTAKNLQLIRRAIYPKGPDGGLGLEHVLQRGRIGVVGGPVHARQRDDVAGTEDHRGHADAADHDDEQQYGQDESLQSALHGVVWAGTAVTAGRVLRTSAGPDGHGRARVSAASTRSSSCRGLKGLMM